MPKVELYISDQLCDLRGDESIEVDYTSFDISKIDSRGGARSYSFEIPKTNNNKQILENPEMVNNLSEVPYTRLPCLVLVDGVDVQIRFCEIESAKDNYSIRVYGANSDLFAGLKDLKAHDLDMNDLNHFWTIANQYASRTNTEGYIYPIIDWHLDSPNFAINNDNRTVRNDFILPAIFYNTVLERILQSTNYSLVNEIEDDTANLLITSGFLRRNNDMGRYEASISTVAVTGNSPGLGTYVALDYDLVDADYEYNYWDSSGDSLIIVPRFIDDVDVDIDITFSIRNTTGVDRFIYLRVETATGILLDESVSVLANATISHSISLLSAELRASGNTFPFVDVQFATNSGTAGVMEVLASTITFSNVILVVERPNEAYSTLGTIEGFITPASILPDVTQSDIFKNYLLMFGLLPVVNDLTKVVTLVEFDKLLARLHEAYDWSSKLDYSEEPETRFIFEAYAKNNWFRYKQDGEEIKPAGTDGAITIDNNNLELEKDIVELVFAGTNSVERLIDNPVAQIGVFELGEKTDDREARVLVLDIKTSADLGGDVTYDDQTTTQVVSTYIPLAYFILPDKTLNLGFSDNLLTTYYELLSNVLNRVKITTVLVRLSASDINALDFTRPVFIDKFESYFYISSVKGFSYTENKSTIVELVKLNING